MAEFLLLLLLISVAAGLMIGYPVAFVLAGASLLFALLGNAQGVFDLNILSAYPSRIYGVMTNELLLAVPLFVFMGITLERAKIAEELLETMAGFFGQFRAGLGLSVLLVGALLAASTGIVGATVVTMGLISLPVMLKCKYDAKIATGIICAAGTLGQIIPPSIVLILLGDQISSAYQSVQLSKGNFAASPVSIADLFVGAILPGLMLVGLYALWLIFYSWRYPENVPAINVARHKPSFTKVLKILVAPLLLILVVLGSILAGFATATESAAVGAVGAMLLAATHKALTLENLRTIMRETTKTSAMVFTILIGASLFTIVFRGFGGDDIIHSMLTSLPGGLFMALLIIMLIMFFLGFFLDFIEIIFVVVPIVAPVLLGMGANPVWLAVMIAINLQTSFLTPPFGFALFYLRGAAPKSVKTIQIYRGVVPFVIIQLFALGVLAAFPSIATHLPETLYGSSYEEQDSDILNDIADDYGADF